jgi:uncharacterized membrane protein SpoIIM required for sporulation
MEFFINFIIVSLIIAAIVVAAIVAWYALVIILGIFAGVVSLFQSDKKEAQESKPPPSKPIDVSAMFPNLV